MPPCFFSKGFLQVEHSKDRWDSSRLDNGTPVINNHETFFSQGAKKEVQCRGFLAVEKPPKMNSLHLLPKLEGLS